VDRFVGTDMADKDRYMFELDNVVPITTSSPSLFQSEVDQSGMLGLPDQSGMLGLPDRSDMLVTFENSVMFDMPDQSDMPDMHDQSDMPGLPDRSDMLVMPDHSRIGNSDVIVEPLAANPDVFRSVEPVADYPLCPSAAASASASRLTAVSVPVVAEPISPAVEPILCEEVFLNYMKERARSTIHLLPVGGCKDFCCAKLKNPSRMSKMDKADAISQIIHAMSDVNQFWNEAFGGRSGSIVPDITKFLHWPSLDQVYRMNDGTICVDLESLFSASEHEMNFQTLMSTAFLGISDRIGRQLSKIDAGWSDFNSDHEVLLNVATLLFDSSSDFVDEWKILFPDRMSVPYNDFTAKWVEVETRKIPESMIDAIFTMLNDSGESRRPRIITYEDFCNSGLTFGTWWNPPMIDAFSDLLRQDNGHFFVCHSLEAEKKLETSPGLQYIVRPRRHRSGDDRKKENNILWPFAITAENITDEELESKFIHFVVSFNTDTKVFSIKDKTTGKVFEAENPDDNSKIMDLCKKFLVNKSKMKLI